MVGSGRVDGRGGIDADLVRRLIRTQFPQWADLPVEPVVVDGWDNRTYHLGDDMTVRLPSAKGYAPAIEKEQRWLPFLAPHLPLAVPTPIARGVPGEGYPYTWSINRWLHGDTASPERIDDLSEFASTLAGFLSALQGVDATLGPVAGAHSFFRGASLSHYDDETRRAVAALTGSIDANRALAVWAAALATSWTAPPVWFHGDVAVGNLLVQSGRLTAVIDFGTSGVGDPACDLVIAWTFFFGRSRASFRGALPLDDATWARARGWALWKALIMLAAQIDTDSREAAVNRTVIGEVLDDHDQLG
jgi:aminoglycoside phosphotransferase (APT) family kinase protein